MRVARDGEDAPGQPDPEVSMRYGSAPDRRKRILEFVTSEGFCSVGELAASLDVSEMTVRRDVARLEHEGRLRRVHGGITILPREALSPSAFGDRAADMRMPKQWIAQAAVRLIERGATIGLDAGTTTYELALIMPEHLNLTVATHSLPALTAFVSRKGVRVIGLGGQLQPATQDFVGLATQAAIAELSLSVLFLAGRGITERGLFCANDHEALVKRKLLEVADRVVLLADSSKFRSAAMVRVCQLEDIDCMVTDDDIRQTEASIIADHGVDLVIAPRVVLPDTVESELA
jgi:DeoR family transcriptional regulator, aga operon transcriptional repressor